MIEEAKKFSKQLKTLYRELKHLEGTIGGALWGTLGASKGSVCISHTVWSRLDTSIWATEVWTES